MNDTKRTISIRLTVVLLTLGLLIPVGTAVSAAGNLSPAGKIAAVIKSHLGGLDADGVRERMAGHFRQMRLLDAKGIWQAPALAAIADQLLPDDLDAVLVGRFVDLTAHYAGANPYLQEFLVRAESEFFPDFAAKVTQEGPVVFPDVVTYALTLDRLTRAMCEDWQVLDACEQIWRRERKSKLQLVHHLGGWAACFFVKLASVEKGIDLILTYQKSGQVPFNFLRFILPLNILEASGADLGLGYWGNARTGRILAGYRPGARVQDKLTGEGPTIWSADKKIILFQMALPREWADLYTTWNLAFVSMMIDSPYLMTKLLIPAVNDYADTPASYIYKRGVALFAHLHYAGFRSWDEAQAGKKPLRWLDRSLTQFWGRVNAECATAYDQAVKACSQSATKGH